MSVPERGGGMFTAKSGFLLLKSVGIKTGIPADTNNCISEAIKILGVAGV